MNGYVTGAKIQLGFHVHAETLPTMPLSVPTLTDFCWSSFKRKVTLETAAPSAEKLAHKSSSVHLGSLLHPLAYIKKFLKCLNGITLRLPQSCLGKCQAQACIFPIGLTVINCG